MPIYEYKCRNCNYIEALFQNNSENKKDLSCEKCGGKLERILSIFNMSGCAVRGNSGCANCSSSNCRGCPIR